MKLNKLAWAILDDDEKNSLNLQHVHNKSSWESGEIMGKSHYKYLEIKYRASKFLEIFTDHFTFYNEIAPEDIKFKHPELRIYFTQCIQNRLKPMSALQRVLDLGYRINKSQLNSFIIEEFNSLKKSGDPHALNFVNLVLEFDRWNNFRILPKELQEPSAYKRRIKNQYKKHLKVMSSIPPLSLDKLLELYETKRAPYFILPLITHKGPAMYKIKNNKNSLAFITSLALYIFKPEDMDTASKYLSSCFNYLSKGEKTCQNGLEFWPKYRELIDKAINYNEVQNISPSRKYLDLAMSKLEFL